MQTELFGCILYIKRETSDAVLIELAAKIWKLLPPNARLAVTRLTQKKFTASVAAIITNEMGEVLILDHVLRPASGWGIPGGFMQHFEQPDDAIRREIREETGLELKNLKFYRIRNIRRHIEVIFTANADGHAAVKSREIISVKWFRPDDLPPEMNSDQQLLIHKIFKTDI